MKGAAKSDADPVRPLSASSTSDIASLLIAAEQKRCDCLVNGDFDQLAGLLSDRLHFMHGSGRLDDKASLLALLSSRAIVYETCAVSELRPTVIEPTFALLTSRLSAAIHGKNGPKTVDNRTLSVWVVEQGSWRLLAYQPTPLMA